MNHADIEKRLEEFRNIGKAAMLAYRRAKPDLQPKTALDLSPRCLACGELMVSIPHSELVDDHFGCGGCGKVFYECDGRLWACKFPEQDVPGWKLKHDREHLQKPAQGVFERARETEQPK